MDSEDYVVITLPEIDTTRSALRGPRAGMRGGPSIDELGLERKTLDRAGVREEAARGNLVVRAGVPLQLIQPREAAPEIEAAAVAAPNLWGLEAVGALGSSRTGAGITVAVLDTGCDTAHSAFARLKAAGKIAGRNFTAGAADDVADTHGHGTHCAGTICGGTVDGRRIGVAPGIEKLVIGKVLGAGGGDNAKILQAIQWAAMEGAQIISMSLGIDFPGYVEELHTHRGLPIPAATSVALRDYRETVSAFGKLSDFLSNLGVLVVAASGNESQRPEYRIDKSPPAASPNIISVGAVGKSNAIAEFSNTGCDLVAPGVDIVSARKGGGLSTKSGTSMATPHVVGVAALWAEQLLAQGNLSHQTLKAELLASAKRVAGGAVEDFGSGLATAPA
jgi:subtilisin family serine protease